MTVLDTILSGILKNMFLFVDSTHKQLVFPFRSIPRDTSGIVFFNIAVSACLLFFDNGFTHDSLKVHGLKESLCHEVVVLLLDGVLKKGLCGGGGGGT